MTTEPIEGEVVDEETRERLPAVVAHEASIARGELTVDEIVTQKAKIVEIMERVMTEGVHYGRIPGINKPTLYKPGAEAINVALRLDPDYESEKIWGPGDHLTVVSKCVLYHIPTRLRIASGEGLCSSREAKYATRKQKRLCPECGQPQIRRSKYPPKAGDSNYVEGETEPGWYCWKKEGGCGVNFSASDPRITSQEEGEVENPELPDTWNTVLKMADKRALVAAVLNGTAASDVFTQDVEDQPAARAADAPTEPQPQVSRREGVQPFPIPKNWNEIELAVRTCDNKEEAWALFQAFLRSAAYHLFGETDQEKLDKDQRMVLVQKAAGAAVWLNENIEYEMGELFFFDEAKQRRAWKHVLDADLKIPDYEPPEPPAPPVDEEAERLARETFAGDPPGDSPVSG